MYRPTKLFFVFSFMITFLAAACSKSSNPLNSSQPAQTVERIPAGKVVAVTSDSQPGLTAADPNAGSAKTNSGTEISTGDTDAAVKFPGSETGSGMVGKSHGSNHPPVLNRPQTNGNRVLLMPRGPAAFLAFSGEPATDPDGDDLSYRFAFALSDGNGIQTPEEVLLSITREGNRFGILPDGDITPAVFSAVYGGRANIPVVQSAIYASDGTAESIPEVYGLFVVYDASAQFSAPAEYVADQQWENPNAIDWYEGTSAPADGAFPTWTGVTAGHRDWRLDRAPRTIRCEIVTFSGFYSFEDWGEDNDLFTVASEARATSGTVRLSFNSTPDFESPADEDGDNVYQLRAVNTHDINNINLEGNPTGCSGSLLDFTIRVKDVGVPAPPSIVNARFLESDDTMLAVSWLDPAGFFEDGSLVPFPEGFEVNDYDYRYRPYGEAAWTEEVDDFLTDTSVTIDGLTEMAYEVQVRASNREGDGEWSTAVVVSKLTHTVCFGTSQYTAVEGNSDGVAIEVHLDPAAGSVPVTVPIEIVEENGAGSDDYIGVPSSVTFEPDESVKTFSVVALTDEDQDEGTEEFIRMSFVDLPENVSTESPASAEVVLEDEPSKPTIVSLRISSTPVQGSFYDNREIIEVEVVFSEPVDVVASIRPYVWLRIDYPNRKKARYSHGTGTNKLYFQYSVGLHDFDTSGVGVDSGDIQAIDGSITAISNGVTADLHQNGLPDDLNHRVDGCLR